MDGKTARENFGRNLRILRERHGYGSRELSRMMNSPECSVNQYERHGIVPELGNLVKLCEILETTPDRLFGYRPLNEE